MMPPKGPLHTALHKCEVQLPKHDSNHQSGQTSIPCVQSKTYVLTNRKDESGGDQNTACCNTRRTSKRWKCRKAVKQWDRICKVSCRCGCCSSCSRRLNHKQPF